MSEGDIPSELPKGWVRVRLDEVAEVRLGRQRSPKNHSGTQMRPYLRAANVDWNGLKLDDVKEMNFTDEEVAVYGLKKGDIVLSEASGSASEVGKPAIWNNEIADCCFQNTLIRVRSYGIDPYFLLYFLRGEAKRGAFVEHSRGVGIHHIGVARLAAWEVPVPPLGEQRRIVSATENQIAVVERAEAAIHSALSRAAALRRSLFSVAFSGQLVSQDPDDEPVEELLKRSKVAIEAAAKEKSTRRRSARSSSAQSKATYGGEENSVRQQIEASPTATQPTLDLEMPS
ncbi:restriction endonuclease subunit S [Streptomyces sp. NPDC006134]|uniref:restriction endonuclease subunit S n=1 Tax=Streptomyces sp. NPDC006134 TaxID=3154467 RepID=UPI0033C8D796